MRTILLLLVLGGLLLAPLPPALAWPGDGPSARPHCAVDRDAGDGGACAQHLGLSGRIEGSDLLLRWEGSAAPAFEIYYSSAPFTGYVPIDRAQTPFYLEQLAHVNSTVINDFYRVREIESGRVSNRLGVFTFALHG